MWRQTLGFEDPEKKIFKSVFKPGLLLQSLVIGSLQLNIQLQWFYRDNMRYI